MDPEEENWDIVEDQQKWILPPPVSLHLSLASVPHLLDDFEKTIDLTDYNFDGGNGGCSITNGATGASLDDNFHESRCSGLRKFNPKNGSGGNNGVQQQIGSQGTAVNGPSSSCSEVNSNLHAVSNGNGTVLFMEQQLGLLRKEEPKSRQFTCVSLLPNPTVFPNFQYGGTSSENLNGSSEVLSVSHTHIGNASPGSGPTSLPAGAVLDPQLTGQTTGPPTLTNSTVYVEDISARDLQNDSKGLVVHIIAVVPSGNTGKETVMIRNCLLKLLEKLHISPVAGKNYVFSLVVGCQDQQASPGSGSQCQGQQGNASSPHANSRNPSITRAWSDNNPSNLLPSSSKSIKDMLLSGFSGLKNGLDSSTNQASAIQTLLLHRDVSIPETYEKCKRVVETVFCAPTGFLAATGGFLSNIVLGVAPQQKNPCNTNLWEVLRTGLELTKRSLDTTKLDSANGGPHAGKQRPVRSSSRSASVQQGSPSANQVSSASRLKRVEAETNQVLVFSDTEPTERPPRGHITCLRKYLEKEKISGLSIHTIGFGASCRSSVSPIQSKLLQEIAIVGRGQFMYTHASSPHHTYVRLFDAIFGSNHQLQNKSPPANASANSAEANGSSSSANPEPKSFGDQPRSRENSNLQDSNSISPTSPSSRTSPIISDVQLFLPGSGASLRHLLGMRGWDETNVRIAKVRTQTEKHVVRDSDGNERNPKITTQILNVAPVEFLARYCLAGYEDAGKDDIVVLDEETSCDNKFNPGNWINKGLKNGISDLHSMNLRGNTSLKTIDATTGSTIANIQAEECIANVEQKKGPISGRRSDKTGSANSERNGGSNTGVSDATHTTHATEKTGQEAETVSAEMKSDTSTKPGADAGIAKTHPNPESTAGGEKNNNETVGNCGEKINETSSTSGAASTGTGGTQSGTPSGTQSETEQFYLCIDLGSNFSRIQHLVFDVPLTEAQIQSSLLRYNSHYADGRSCRFVVGVTSTHTKATALIEEDVCANDTNVKKNYPDHDDETVVPSFDATPEERHLAAQGKVLCNESSSSSNNKTEMASSSTGKEIILDNTAANFHRFRSQSIDLLHRVIQIDGLLFGEENCNRTVNTPSSNGIGSLTTAVNQSSTGLANQSSSQSSTYQSSTSAVAFNQTTFTLSLNRRYDFLKRFVDYNRLYNPAVSPGNWLVRILEDKVLNHLSTSINFRENGGEHYIRSLVEGLRQRNE